MSFDKLRKYTQARIGLGHSGAALPTKAWLDFSQSHAQAVDAIKIPWDLCEAQKTFSALGLKSEVLRTKISDREHYLSRPDLGRLLDDDSLLKLKTLGPCAPGEILVVLSNGLSSLAASSHGANFISRLCSSLYEENLSRAQGRIFLVENARVALIDDMGEILKPELGIIVIGERPGLSAPDSLAAYLSYEPKKGLNDASRNCISNIRPPFGLGYEEAVLKLKYLIKESLKRKLSGVNLKEESALKELNPQRQGRLNPKV